MLGLPFKVTLLKQCRTWGVLRGVTTRGLPSTATNGTPSTCATAQPQLSAWKGSAKLSTASAPDSCRTYVCSKAANRQQGKQSCDVGRRLGGTAARLAAVTC